MNSLFVLLNIESWKPVLTALMLPPVPFLALTLLGMGLVASRRGLGWLLALVAFAGLWLGACNGAGEALVRLALKPPSALDASRRAELRREVQARRPLAIVVLGGGREALAPEYGTANLTRWSLERLRYAVWLSRETGAPLAYSGGAGWSQPDGPPETEAAARIAAQDFGRPLRWTESDSRDTQENAARTVALLHRAGVEHIVLVTHGWHMPRALRAFESAARGKMRVEAAPMGLALRTERPPLDWLPSGEGYILVRQVLREWLGLRMGA